jgi:predicted RNase H-like HicB family nuclease
MLYTIVLFREPEGGYTVTVPALQGCVTYGENLAKALDMAREAVELYLESLHDDSLPSPPDMPAVTVALDDQQEAMVLRLEIREAEPVA